MYAKTAGPIHGPLIGSYHLRPEFADNDGTGSAFARSLGSLDAPEYIPLGGVAEDIYSSWRDPSQLRASRENGFVFPAKATLKEQETYRMHRELREVKAQRDELLAIAQRLAAIDGGAWHAARHERERAELLNDTRAAIARATGGQA